MLYDKAKMFLGKTFTPENPYSKFLVSELAISSNVYDSRVVLSDDNTWVE